MINCNSKQQRQGSPSSSTTSMSMAESNVVTAASITDDVVRDQSSCCNLKAALKIDGDGDVEVQSPDRSLLESLFAEQLDFSTDFMICSPRRDFMIYSPRRGDLMLTSSPKGDFMVSSPRRDHHMMMVSSPKRDYGMVVSPRRAAAAAAGGNYLHGLHGPPAVVHPAAYSAAGYGVVAGGVLKTASPLQKVSNSSSSSSALYASYSSAAATTDQFLHGDSLALPVVDAFLEDYGREVYELHPSLLKSSVDGGGAEAGEATLPSLLDCFVMESRYDQSSEMMGSRIHLGGDQDDMYQSFGGGAGEAYPELQQKAEMDHGFLCSVGSNNSGATNIVPSATASAVEDPYQVVVGDASCVIPPENEQEQDSGLQLVHLLLACAEAISKDDLVAARRYLHHLNRGVCPLGDSMQRVASCFVDALADRLNHGSSSSSSSSSSCSSSSSSSSSSCGFALRKHSPFPPPHLDVLKIYQIIYQACPYIKFAHFTANQAIFEAFESEDCVHVIDLDILQGYQWPAFLQALAARPGGAPALRITGIGHPAEAVRETGRHLAELAHSLRVPFEFHPAAVDHLEDLRPSMLHRRIGEALAVNSVNRLHRVPGAHLGPLLAMIRDQAPKIFTLVEQEASHNGPYFLGRFLEALHYYSAIFDSLDATFPRDSAARAKVERFLLAPEIKNIVASEGRERVVRHERLERWRRVMEGRGFKGVPLSSNAVNQSKLLLGLYPCDGYRLTEDKGCLLLGWQDRPLIAASAWRC